MKLKEICHSRTGDKGDISNISLIPWNEADYPMLKEQVTAQRVKEYFSEICLGKVTRYEADGICALNFVMEQALGGGVLVLVAGVALWRYHRVAVKQFGGITGDLAGWFLQKAELYMLAALVFCQWKGFL